MKVFSSILAIYMMAVFLTPCADMSGRTPSPNHSPAEELAHQDRHSHSEKPDLCSPFCLCNCCGAVSGFVFTWNAFRFSDVSNFELAKPYPRFISRFIPHYFGEIWQPPQING